MSSAKPTPPFLVKICYKIDESNTYHQTKVFFQALLEDPKSPMRPWFDGSMVFLILASVAILIYSVKNPIGLMGECIEFFAVSLFIIEYLLRFWICSHIHQTILTHYERLQMIHRPFQYWPPLKEIIIEKWRYVSSPMAIIDLLSILPSYRPLRVFRIFLLFRLFKLFRYTRSIHLFVSVINEKKHDLYTLLIVLSFVIFTASSAFYLFENKSEGGQINHFVDAIYWALVTLSTVGYGDITPHTDEGRFVALVLMMSGVAVVAFFTSIIVSAFNEQIEDIQQHRLFKDLKRKKGHIVILGFGQAGQSVAREFTQNKQAFVIVDNDEKKIALAKKQHYLTLLGDGSTVEIQQQLSIDRLATHLICLTNSDVSNLYAVLNARHHNPDLIIISRAKRPETERKLKQAGANYIVQSTQIIPIITQSLINQPIGFDTIWQVMGGHHDVALDTLYIPENSQFNHKSIAEINFKQRGLLLFGVVTMDKKQNEEGAYQMSNGFFYFNPSDLFFIQSGDYLVLIGHQFGLRHFKDLVHD